MLDLLGFCGEKEVRFSPLMILFHSLALMARHLRSRARARVPPTLGFALRHPSGNRSGLRLAETVLTFPQALFRPALLLHFMIDHNWTRRALHDLWSAFESKQAPQEAWIVASRNNQISVPLRCRKPNFLCCIPHPKIRLATWIYSTHLVAETNQPLLCSITFLCVAPMHMTESEFHLRLGRKYVHEHD